MNNKVEVVDRYTPEQFAHMLFATRIRRSIQQAEKYIQENPKKYYTNEDTLEAYYGKNRGRVWRATPDGTTKRYKQSDTMGSDSF